MSYLIYMHVLNFNCPHNTWCYIGLTKQTLSKRWKSGNGYMPKNQLVFAAAIQKYGWENFNHLILEDNIDTLEKANEREKYWIAYYHSYIHDPICHGYNMTPGGDGTPGHKMSEAMKEKIKADRFSKLLERFSKEAIDKIYVDLLTKDNYTLTKAAIDNKTCPEVLKKLFNYYKYDFEILKKKLKKHSAETIKKLSIAANKRDNTVYKGIKHKPVSAETREKLKNSHTGKILSEEQKQKIGAAHRGKTVSEITREKIRIKHLNKKVSEQQKNKISKAFHGRKHITNGIENKFILEIDLDYYLKNGWYLGRTIKKREK